MACCEQKFDVVDFRRRYTDFENIKDAQLYNFYDIARLVLAKWAFQGKETEYKILLYLLVAHFATLQVRGASVGVMSSASEGSVSIGWQLPPMMARSWWYHQTPYGATYWELTKKYRTGGCYFDYHNSHTY